MTAIVSTVVVGGYLAALVVCLMLTGGEALEDFAAGRAKKDLSALLERAPRVEVVADIDDSSLTGESLPVTRTSADPVLSGALNGQQAFTLRATATAEDSQYARILALVKDAAESRAPMVRLADRYAAPFTLVAYLIGGLAWWFSGDQARFAEVLVVATPCPLPIAAPVAFMGGISRAAVAVSVGQRTLQVAKQSIWVGIALSLVLMGLAAFGVIPAIVGALFQEVVDVVAILNALRAMRAGHGELQDFSSLADPELEPVRESAGT